MKFSLEDVLAPFRAIESNDDVLVVLGDEHAMKALIAWTKVDNVWTHPPTKRPAMRHGNMASAWAWVISGWNIDEQTRAIARLAGLPTDVAHEKIEILVGNRLIYPDGSLAKGTRVALNLYTAKKLGIKQQLPKASQPQTSTDKDDRGN